MSEMIDKAKDKLDKELKDFKGWKMEKAVSSHVAKTLKQFCSNEVFARAITLSAKTLSECCASIMKGVGGSISDIEVYRKAAQFYFPKAKIDFKMEIQVDGVNSEVEEAANVGKPRAKKKAVEVNKNASIQLSLFEED